MGKLEKVGKDPVGARDTPIYPSLSLMGGLTLASLKKHPALIPLYVCLGAGVAGATFYTLRLAFRNPDVSWNRNGNPEPQQEWANKQYKFWSPIRDYSTYRAPVPKYSE